jgi:hypothetical protein
MRNLHTPSSTTLESDAASASDCEERSWYCAVATYKAVIDGVPRKRHLWQRNMLLISAPENRNPNSLRKQAETVAREKEHEYENTCGSTVRWVFQEIEDIVELSDCELGEGSEVYWQVFVRVDKNAN